MGAIQSSNSFPHFQFKLTPSVEDIEEEERQEAKERKELEEERGKVREINSSSSGLQSKSCKITLLQITLILLLLIINPTTSETGEQACESQSFTKSQCEVVGCCEWDSNSCWSAVGGGSCGSTSPTFPVDDVKIPTYPIGPYTPTWISGTGIWATCSHITQVFGVTVCLTNKAWNKGRDKVDHIAQVLAQLIDNDADGVADDPNVVKYMAASQMFMFTPYSESDADSASYPSHQGGQMTGLFEAQLNCCDTPSNRGASDTDRATWIAAIDNTPGETSCNPNRDATVEEVHHLIGEAASRVYPSIWKTDSTSEAGKSILSLNGDCGWGHSNDWKNPGGANSQCTGTYAYDDPTCDEECIIMEGIYWSSISWIGGLYTTSRANMAANEWLMTVPDTGMTPLPSNDKNSATLQEGAPALYQLISDTTSEGHKWLPSIMPNGAYTVTSDSAVASCGVYPGFSEEDCEEGGGSSPSMVSFAPSSPSTTPPSSTPTEEQEVLLTNVSYSRKPSAIMNVSFALIFRFIVHSVT